MDPHRLPPIVVPRRYDIRLEPDLQSGTFTGSEEITIDVREDTREIVLNAIDLEVRSAVLHVAEQALGCEIGLDPLLERLHLTFTESVPAGSHRLALTFAGTLNDQLRGFYRSTYESGDGRKHTLAVTQFEATDARRAFPCWDEPAFKARFRLTVSVPEELTVVSNAPVVSADVRDGRKVVAFAETMPMSTYLVAVLVGELVGTAPVRVGATDIAVWCVPGKESLTAFAEDIAAYSLAYFEDYYARAYPEKKLDLIAIPDFAAGAMENLGAITFRETALLVDPAAATHAELQRVAEVVAHENAHMWFGDLVTMRWWNGLWLNEAFATFMESKCVDAWKPEWERWTKFGVAREEAFEVDGLRSTRPVEFEVEAPKDAEAMFDVLTYEKGGSVLRMFEQYLGADVFREGVRAYLEDHEYDNADTDDLWQALGRAAGSAVPELMNPWVFRPGYPVVGARLDGNGSLRLTQRRFTYLATDEDEAPWPIPVQVRTRAGGEVRDDTLLLKDGEGGLAVPDSPDWVSVNRGGHGFYRVHYSDDLLSRLLGNLADLAPIERFMLVSDLWATCLAGLTPAPAFLAATESFRTEGDRHVWTMLGSAFREIHGVVDRGSLAGLARLIRDRAGPAFTALGWNPSDGEGELRRQLRGDLIRLLGTIGEDEEVRVMAAEVAACAADDVDPEVAAAVVPVQAATGDETLYETFVQRQDEASTPQEERRYLLARCALPDPGLVVRTLDEALAGRIRTQDGPLVTVAALRNRHARASAWRFVRERWDEMDRTFPAQALRRICLGLDGLADPELEADVRRFFAERRIDLGGRAVDQALERLRVLVAFGEREGTALADFLRR